MPWCPKCRYEYVPRITRCPECGAELVAELPPQPEPPGEPARAPYGEGPEFEQVLLCTVLGDTHRALVQNALAEAGISSRQQIGNPDLSIFTRGYPAPLTTFYSIYVNRRDLERALDIYRAYEQPSE